MTQDTFDYSAATGRLEEILANLQANETDIEEALALYEEGMQLVHKTEAYLEQAQHRITKLTTKA